MNNNLQSKVQFMLDGETKRRATALRWVTEVIEAILPAAEPLWGSGESDFSRIGNGSVSLKSKDRFDVGDLYFRFIPATPVVDGDTEDVGFYVDQSGYRIWGTPISDLKGSDFWWAVRSIMEWVPVVTQMLDEKGLSRDKLVERMK